MTAYVDLLVTVFADANLLVTAFADANLLVLVIHATHAPIAVNQRVSVYVLFELTRKFVVRSAYAPPIVVVAQNRLAFVFANVFLAFAWFALKFQNALVAARKQNAVTHATAVATRVTLVAVVVAASS